MSFRFRHFSGLKTKIKSEGKNMIERFVLRNTSPFMIQYIILSFLAELLTAVALNGFHSCIPYGSLFLK